MTMASPGAATRPAYQGWVISHTHWDREWYLPFQRFRFQLVEAVDRLLDILDTEPSYQYFHLDGQTVILNDYLEVRPDQRERLARHLRSGRIEMGPWYVLPDEFLISPESLIRNLLIGRLQAKAMGEVMTTGYLPDTFGHPAQIPQILRGFNIDNCVIFRGVQTPYSEFVWQAPDGSEVLAIYLTFSYCNGMTLTANPTRFIEHRIPENLEKLPPLATTEHLLFMNGCDHIWPRAEIQQVIDAANRRYPDLQLKQATLPQYIDAVKGALGVNSALPADLTRISGEFRHARPARITPGVISTRMYLKQQNLAASALLEKVAEPLAAVAWAAGEQYPRHWLNLAWQYLLQNHPHDSICGCSVDDVHRDMEARFRWVREIGHEVSRRALAAIAGRVPPSGDDVAEAVVFNTLPQPYTGPVTFRTHSLRPARVFHAEDASGNAVPAQARRRHPVALEYDPYAGKVQMASRADVPVLLTPPSEIAALRATAQIEGGKGWQGEEQEVTVYVKDVPPLGYQTLRLVRGEGHKPASDLKIGDNWLENSHVSITVNRDGSFDLLDKTSGRKTRNLGWFMDRGDAGDEYTFSPPRFDHIVRSGEQAPELRVAERGPARVSLDIKHQLRVPAALTSERTRRSGRQVRLPVTLRVSLTPDSPRVDLRVQVDNLAEDHLLQIVFPTGIKTAETHAAGQFQVVTRPITEVETGDWEWCRRTELTEGKELTVDFWPQGPFVDVNDGQVGLAILNRGLTEFEQWRDDDTATLAITLLRCVGYLSRADLVARQGNAGPTIATPEAQCPGKHTFELALLPHAGGWQAANLPAEGDRFIAPPSVARLDSALTHTDNGSVAQDALPVSALTVEPASLLLSALKRAEEDDRRLIVRLFNASTESTEARIHVGWPVRQAQIVNMAEEAAAADDNARVTIDADGTLRFPVGAWQIVTLAIEGDWSPRATFTTQDGTPRLAPRVGEHVAYGLVGSHAAVVSPNGKVQ